IKMLLRAFMRRIPVFSHQQNSSPQLFFFQREGRSIRKKKKREKNILSGESNLKQQKWEENTGMG
ncbi:hypothetical protein K5549_021657, partial [Capra hircus]